MVFRKSLQYLFLILFAFSFLVPPLFAPTGNFSSRIIWITLPIAIIIYFYSEIGQNKSTHTGPSLKEYNYFPIAKSATRNQSSLELNATFFFMSGFSALMFFMTLLCYDDVTNPRLHSLVILVTYFGKQIFTIVDRIPFAIVASEGSIEVEKIQSIFTASLLYFSIAVIYYLISKIFGHFGRRELVTNARRISERGSLLGLIAFSAAGVFGDYTVLGGSVLTVSENSHPRLYGWLHSLCLDAICFAASDLATIWAATCFGLMIFVFPLFAITGMLAALRKIRQI